MQNRFYMSALQAAATSPEAFAEEFKKSEADLYAREYNYPTSDSLLFSMIEQIEDDKLPQLLEILIQHNIDLDRKNTALFVNWTPLKTAIHFGKKTTCNFLIEHKAKVDSSQSLLCTAIQSRHLTNESDVLVIVKTLVDHGDSVNPNNTKLKSPLMSAAYKKYPQVIEYLLSQGADLFSKFEDHSVRESGYMTAVGDSYHTYLLSKKFKKDIIRAEQCLNLLVNAILNYCAPAQDPLSVSKVINDLSGIFTIQGFGGILTPTNNHELKKFLEDKINFELSAQNRMHTFCMGSVIRDKNKTKASPNYLQKFFNHDGKHIFVRKIDSYLESPAKKQKN